MSAVAEVLLVVPVLEPAGAERIVAELAKRLPQHGFSTSVLCFEDETAAVGVELSSANIAARLAHDGGTQIRISVLHVNFGPWTLDSFR
ncbi:MAG TPA: hypothetical protein VKX17_07545 [Planctomycetota bacterium]|nr:hypothetical protein [Planctomycetota bacterium]